MFINIRKQEVKTLPVVYDIDDLNKNESHSCGTDCIKYEKGYMVCTQCGEIVSDCVVSYEMPRNELIFNDNGRRKIEEHHPPMYDRSGKSYMHTVMNKQYDEKNIKIFMHQKFIIKEEIRKFNRNDLPFQVLDSVYDAFVDYFDPYKIDDKYNKYAVETIFRLCYKKYHLTRDLIEIAACSIYTTLKNEIPFISKSTVEKIISDLHKEYDDKNTLDFTNSFKDGKIITIEANYDGVITNIAEKCETMDELLTTLQEKNILFRIQRKRKSNVNEKLYSISRLIEESKLELNLDFNIYKSIDSVINYVKLSKFKSKKNNEDDDNKQMMISLNDLSNNEINVLRNATIKIYNIYSYLKGKYPSQVPGFVPSFMICILFKILTLCLYDKQIYINFKEISKQTEYHYQRNIEKVFKIVCLKNERKIDEIDNYENYDRINNVFVTEHNKLNKILFDYRIT